MTLVVAERRSRRCSAHVIFLPQRLGIVQKQHTALNSHDLGKET